MLDRQNIDKTVGVSVDHDILLRVISATLFSYFEHFREHSRIAQEASLHLPKSHTKAITRVPQIVTYMIVGERNGEQRLPLVEP